MADKLAIYNAALFALGERRIATLSEDREPRRVLDAKWNDVGNECLEEGSWSWARRTRQFDADTSIVPPFGYAYAFDKPSDWMRTDRVSADGDFAQPLTDYLDEAGYWWARVTPIYVSYVSSDALFGWNVGAWTPSFGKYVALRLAASVGFRISGSENKAEAIAAEAKVALKSAQAKDAMSQPPSHFPQGSWASSRRSYRSGGCDPTRG